MSQTRRHFLQAAVLGASLGSAADSSACEALQKQPNQESGSFTNALAALRQKTGLKIQRIETCTRDTTVSFLVK